MTPHSLPSTNWEPSCEQALIDMVNQTPGKSPRMGYDCPICRNKEFVLTLENGLRRAKSCSCLRIRQNLTRLKSRGLLELYDQRTFERFQTPYAWQQQAKEAAMTYADSDLNRWFFLSGPSGCGKTHLCTAIASSLILSGHDVQIFRWVEWASNAKGVVTDAAAYAALLEPLKTCQVLYLDDFLKVQRGTSPTAADIRLAFEVLDARYNHGDKPVILSTEFNLRQIAGFDEALAGRIVERSRGFAVQIQGGSDRNHRFASG